MKKLFKIFTSIIILISMLFVSTGANATFASGHEKLIAEEPTATYEQIYKWADDNNASDLYLSLLPVIWDKSVEKGIDPVVTASQVALETGYLKHGAGLSIHNTCGLKSRTNTHVYAEFDSWEDGIQAQVNHLALYAGISGNSNSWLYGKCKTVEGLAGLWAEDSGYSNKLLSMIHKIQNTEVSDSYLEEHPDA